MTDEELRGLERVWRASRSLRDWHCWALAMAGQGETRALECFTMLARAARRERVAQRLLGRVNPGWDESARLRASRLATILGYFWRRDLSLAYLRAAHLLPALLERPSDDEWLGVTRKAWRTMCADAETTRARRGRDERAD